MRELQRRSSSFSSPTAFSSWSERRELEHTSSANSGLWWAGVIFSGFISCSSTGMPRWASCQAASQPARPAPMIFTGSIALLLEIRPPCRRAAMKCFWGFRPAARGGRRTAPSSVAAYAATPSPQEGGRLLGGCGIRWAPLSRGERLWAAVCRAAAPYTQYRYASSSVRPTRKSMVTP